MKVLPCPGVLDEPDFAAEQGGQFAADGQAEAGAAVLAARAGVGLLERLEDELLLLRRDADAGVRHREGNDHAGARRSTGWSGDQPLRHVPTRTSHVALRGELEGVRQQVLQNLLQALGVAS